MVNAIDLELARLEIPTIRALLTRIRNAKVFEEYSQAIDECKNLCDSDWRYYLAKMYCMKEDGVLVDEVDRNIFALELGVHKLQNN